MHNRSLRRWTIAFAASAAACVSAWSCGQASDDAAGPRAGTWTLRYVSPSTIDLELSYRNGDSSWNEGDTRAFASAGVHGLTMDDLRTGHGDKHFTIVRDAGTFACDGTFSSGIASGVYTFEPSASYADALAARGLGRPDAADAFRLAFSDVSLATVDDLIAAHVSGLSIPGLVRLSEHGVGASYVKELDDRGVHVASVDDLVRLRDHGVDPDFVAGLAKYGFHPSSDELVRLRDHGVDSDFVAGLSKYGYHPSTDELVRLRDHGVDLAFVARLAAHGYHPSVDDLIRLRDSGM